MPLLTSVSALVYMQGLEAGIHRQLIFTGLRLGLYGSILDAFTTTSRDTAHVGERAAAALCTSAIGISLANPSGGHSATWEQSRPLRRTRRRTWWPLPHTVNQLALRPDPAHNIRHEHADVVKVRTQASEARQAAASSSARHQAAAASTRTQPVAQMAKTVTSTGVKRSFSAKAQAAAVPPGLYSGPAAGVYRHIVATEGVVGAYAFKSPSQLRFGSHGLRTICTRFDGM